MAIKASNIYFKSVKINFDLIMASNIENKPKIRDYAFELSLFLDYNKNK